MRLKRLMAAAASVLILSGCVQATETGANPSGPGSLMLQRIVPRTGQTIEVSSSAFDPQGNVPNRYSGYGANVSPPLHWAAVACAGAYAVVVEDPDAPQTRPFVHWLIRNLPASGGELPEGARSATPPAVQGRNDAGEPGYFGPRPPTGSGVHHYHFEVFALDGPLALAEGSDVEALLRSMRGRVLAQGELVGVMQAP